MVEALTALREDLAALKPSKKRDIREAKQQIKDLEREIEVRAVFAWARKFATKHGLVFLHSVTVPVLASLGRIGSIHCPFIV